MNIVWHPEKSVILTEDIGQDCTIHALVWIGRKVTIGSRVKIQAFCFIPDGVTLEDDVFLGPAVVCTNDLFPPSGRDRWLPTLVKCGASIGANSTIVCGVTIGENAMIGAGSVVTRNVPHDEIWAGNPARFLRKR
jgi:acetyltransferase-like isoleucine patch superfamily enzyme